MQSEGVPRLCGDKPLAIEAEGDGEECSPPVRG